MFLLNAFLLFNLTIFCSFNTIEHLKSAKSAISIEKHTNYLSFSSFLFTQSRAKHINPVVVSSSVKDYYRHTGSHHIVCTAKQAGDRLGSTET